MVEPLKSANTTWKRYHLLVTIPLVSGDTTKRRYNLQVVFIFGSGDTTCKCSYLLQVPRPFASAHTTCIGLGHEQNSKHLQVVIPLVSAISSGHTTCKCHFKWYDHLKWHTTCASSLSTYRCLENLYMLFFTCKCLKCNQVLIPLASA